MEQWFFDGTFTGLLTCVFRAFQFKQFNIEVIQKNTIDQQFGLFLDPIEIFSNDIQAKRVWDALQQKVSRSTIRNIYCAFLSEDKIAIQHIFNLCIYIFNHTLNLEKNYNHPSVLLVAQWAKKVGREKHRMEAFVRFKKTQQNIYIAMIHPDFNVLPIILNHFRKRYQDQQWLIYDDLRKIGIYYDLNQVHEIRMNVDHSENHSTLNHQHLNIEMDEDELKYDELWKAYFKSVNIKERQNLRLHIQYVPKRYWQYLNEKQDFK
ncbi:MAG: TIGR03915 family putative DNA repair protein [Acinetobacter sp.]